MAMSFLDRIAQKGAEFTQANQRRQQVSRFVSELTKNAQEDALRFPEAAEMIPPLVRKVREALKRYEPGIGMEPIHASVLTFPARNRMMALACLLPPVDGGKRLSQEALKQELFEQKISCGFREKLIAEFVGREKYLHFFPVAKGTPSVNGQNGQIQPLFQVSEPENLEVSGNRTPDFTLQNYQAVQRNTILLTAVPPVPGQTGQNIFGEELACREADEFNVPCGINTELSDDGLQVMATTDGLFYRKGGEYFVQKMMILDGPVMERVNVQHGDVYIKGDVEQGGSVTAPGSIIITGKVQGGEITSTDGSVRVCQGVLHGKVSAAKQVQALLLEDCVVDAGDWVYAEQILNTTLTSGGSVTVFGANGVLAGGSVLAKEQIVCTRLGDSAKGVTSVSVGYTPEVFQTLNQVKEELSTIHQTVEKLRKSVIELRKGGGTLSLEKRSLLSQLVEQRTLYESREQELSSQQKAAQEKLLNARSGTIKCQELLPEVVVRIGDKESKFTKPEKNCRIHIFMGQITSQ